MPVQIALSDLHADVNRAVDTLLRALGSLDNGKHIDFTFGAGTKVASTKFSWAKGLLMGGKAVCMFAARHGGGLLKVGALCLVAKAVWGHTALWRTLGRLRATGVDLEDLVRVRAVLHDWTTTANPAVRISPALAGKVDEWCMRHVGRRTIGDIIRTERVDDASDSDVDEAEPGAEQSAQALPDQRPEVADAHGGGVEQRHAPEAPPLPRRIDPPPGIGIEQPDPAGIPGDEPPGFERGAGAAVGPVPEGLNAEQGNEVPPPVAPPVGAAPIGRVAERPRAGGRHPPRRRARGGFVQRCVDALRASRGYPTDRTAATERAVSDAVTRMFRDMRDVTDRDKATALPLILAAYFVPTGTELQGLAVRQHPQLGMLRRGLDRVP